MRLAFVWSGRLSGTLQPWVSSWSWLPCS